jgi:hypothetical protein
MADRPRTRKAAVPSCGNQVDEFAPERGGFISLLSIYHMTSCAKNSTY